MPKYVLSRDVELTFQRFHTVRAKAGTPLKMVMCGDGPGYVISPSHVETDSPRDPNSIWAHDTKYYYIWAPRDAVSEVAED